MNIRFYLVPAAALVLTQPAHATVYLSVEQAQSLIFKGASFTLDDRTLTDEQMHAIEKASSVNVRSRTLKLWRVSTGGWFIADEVVGKHDFIPFALGLDATGKIVGLEILEYREAYGDGVRGQGWRAQFLGKTRNDQVKLGTDIKNISGATLSSKHVTDGVRRLLATYDIVIAHG
jgi:Na+-translocating ferredoxin:NAD+ oxidoreductase RnfG subunit